MIAAVFGAAVGIAVSGFWWMWRDSTTFCEGGCSGENIPPGDITLFVGAVAGAVLATCAWGLLLALRKRQG